MLVSVCSNTMGHANFFTLVSICTSQSCKKILCVFLLLCTSIDLSFGEDNAWQEPLRTAEVGGSVNLACLCKKRMTTIIWLRQKLGEKPHVIATSYQYQPAMFYNGFKKNERFKATIGPLSFNLSITSLKLSDAATYYCAITFLYDITFGQGTVLIVKDDSSKSSTLIQQEKVQAKPGASRTQCTLITDRCTGNHSVYWFKHNAEESQPVIVYTQGHSGEQCQKNFSGSSLTQTCVYSLPENLSLSDTGTYDCAVAACGEILYGKGPKMKTKEVRIEVFVLLSIIRSAVVVLTFTVCLIFTCTRH